MNRLNQLASGLSWGWMWGTVTLAVACGPSSGTPDAGMSVTCSVVAPTSCPSPAPTYGDVEPIFQTHCVTCHAGAVGGPWPLTDYNHVSDWREDIRADLVTCAMPPPDAGTEMTDAERLVILNWLRCGLPR